MSQEKLKELFEYGDGHLYWKARRRHVTVGHRAGGNRLNNGYPMVRVDYKYHYIHRLIWIYHNGAIPLGRVIDHIDRDPQNNRIENLRLVTHAVNMRNRRRHSNNSTGVRGVSYSKGMKKYLVRINTEVGKDVVLGYSADLAEAAHMRREAEKQYGYI